MVMREQLAALLPLVKTGCTAIQIAPFEAGALALMNGTLILLTLLDNSTTVYQEGFGHGETFDDRETVMRRMLIEATMEKYQPCESPRN